MEKQTILDLKQYQLLNKIDSGTLSDVYRVKKKNSDTLYTAKIISKATDQNLTKATSNFQPEFNKISRISHGSIHKLIGLSPVNFQNKKEPVIISEFLGNGTLKEIINLDRKSKSVKYLNETRKLIIIYGIASAMSFLHSYSIVHQDLKPSNILMDDYLCPQVTDIELTKYFHSDQKTINNAPYISPEIWDKSEYSLAGDVYAFGFIVYELITNEEPFKNLEPNTIKQRVMAKARPKLTSKLPNSYKNLIERCWSQNSLVRPSFDQIVKELREDSGFITDQIKKEDYLDYIKYIDQYNSLIYIKKRQVKIDEFVNRKTTTFQRVEVHKFQYKIELTAEEKDQIAKEKVDKEINELFESGQKLYASNKPLAAQNFKKAADLGHVESMFLYATMLLKGEKIESNPREAAEYFKKAADKGKCDAMFNYALMISKGNGVPINKEEATKYFKKGAELDHVNSMQNYAYNLFNGEGTPVNKKEAAKYFKKAADKDEVSSMYQYATMLNKGDGIPVNKQESIKYYKKAIEKGHAKSMFKYALMLQNGDGIPVDSKEAAKYYLKAISKGDVNSMYNYALMLHDGCDNFPSNKKESAKYFLMAAKKEKIEAIFSYGLMLFRGDGITLNKPKGVEYIKKAADKGCIDAYFIYAYIKYHGDGVQLDKKEAAKYFKLGADKGQINSMFYYALMCSDGIGIKEDKKLAEKYYKMAIEKGYLQAMYNYALMLFNGDGIPTNKKEAASLYQKAADKGHLRSMNSFAMLLFKGEGINEDKKKAAFYFKKAADKGFINSMFYYAFMLYNGDGIKQDKEKSSIYYKKAADKGHVASMFNYALMLYNGDSIQCNKEKAAFYFKMAADKGDIDAMYSYYLMLKKGEVKNADKNEAAHYFKLAIDKGFKNSKIENLSELYSMENKGQIKFKLDNAEGLVFNHDEIFQNLPLKGTIGTSSSISILPDNNETFIYANTEIVCNNNDLQFEEYPNDVKDEIVQIQRQLDLDGYQQKVKIEYIPENDTDENYNNDDIDIDIDIDNDVFVDDESEKDDELVDVKKVPQSSKIVRKPPPPSQLYLLTHDQPKIPEVSKVEEVRKFTQTEKAAEAIASFNNSILSASRYREEMINNHNSEFDSMLEDPLVKFRSKRRRKKKSNS